MSKIKQNRVGLFGGTFDPIHFGHLRAAEEIRQILSLTKIYFIPSSIPPHKEGSDITCASDRLEMLRLAIEGNEYFDISEFELESKSTSYTVDTLEHLSGAHPDTEFYFMLGNELFNHIESWKDYRRLFELAHFAVITRPGFSDLDSNKIPLALKEDFRYYKKIENVISYTKSGLRDVVFTEIGGIEISSTDIRNLIKSNKSIKYLVPDKIEKYIITEKLYA
ncbi:MAG: nicotinate-nucleotide adenylyltransferase [Deltaproteobacteria bacterium]|nr:nicotinate-nucleotide adenylyltransferase [Deltaproteobacteria bacterium]MCK5709159.1 nicotinate-nucleotide adenylyltransferase [Deltaproteobacteria bacterium]